jgi:hypothetical protein
VVEPLEPLGGVEVDHALAVGRIAGGEPLMPQPRRLEQFVAVGARAVVATEHAGQTHEIAAADG